MVSQAKQLSGLPYEWFAYMRKAHPVWFDDKTQMWNLFRYEDVCFVLSNPTLFSAQASPGSPVPGLPSFQGMDDPRHRQMRSLVWHTFSPRMIADLAAHIEQVTDQLLDAVIACGQMDVARDLAYPLPLILMAELLGVPPQDQAKLHEWSNALLSNNTPETIISSPQRHRWAIQCFSDYFRQHVQQHRQQPRADVISRLLEAQVDGHPLSEQAIVEMCLLLMVAGNETTAKLIGNALLAFQQHPQLLQELRTKPALIVSAIEEVGRLYPPIVASERFTTQEVTVAGVCIPAHQPVLFRIASANTDEAQFEEPLSFNTHRTPNKHLGFGQGVHFCLGAFLARLEAKIALSRVLERLQDIQSIPARPPKQVQGLFTFGVESLPITFRVVSCS
ncbi:MAG: cytochrome P450 [Ktedonobacteraceae bacterium]|nr:cytochrome P450 [Ktedonobacteraceae bacterium]